VAVSGLCKVDNDTNVTRLLLKTEIEAVDVVPPNLRTSTTSWQTSWPGVTNWLRSTEKSWTSMGPKQIKESTTMVTLQTTEFRATRMMLTKLRCMSQSKEIDLDSIRNLKANLEDGLRDMEAHYPM
jgi:hypothetical protein